MAINLLSGKRENKDWSCGIGDTDNASLAARAKPSSRTYAVLGFVLGAMTGGAYLYWRDLHEKMPRTRLPENA
jgi:hypothetical protein